jgi:hypothetical protein
MMPPYVFFVNDIDYYVMDGDNANPVPVTVKGSMSAEGFLESIRLGDQAIGIDSIGDETRFMFSLEVDIRGRSPFDLVFSCTDKLGNVDEKPFHFLASEAVDLYTVTLGAQNNSNYGFYFSFTDRKVYSVAEFADKKDDDGFCYGFNISKSVPLFVSPTELARQSIISQTGNKVSSFCGIVAVNNVTFNKTEFDAIRNDAFMRNLNGSEYGTFAFNQIEAGRSYLIKSSAGKRGVVYVQKIESGVAGYVELLIKLQK